ncbi:conserved hypothetical protein [Talaromyces stipitatus ATCC 10500]|uniref:Uncharacterized protein n=1 Tax=Talaromyces stipitatus (strain ATCC 10500 / CBS 375.48 / QM 6759 / NRRL 1006) TaxID=441959 RepID=B8MU65_TALSN|nr:uncharacterized protein TSTA_109620 [Talaromyces stipitatus ATCC 10500]EED11782.1 conserved hypothetical protein [Talaromyces stipitatus ATCC 10500]
MAQSRSEPDKRSLQTALQETTTAATTRAAEGQKIFSPIAAFLDKHRNQSASLSPHLQRALATLSDNLATMAQHHFNAYISGIIPTPSTPSPAPAPSPTPSPVPPTPPPSHPPSGLAQSSYATITKPTLAKPATAAQQTKPPIKKPISDAKQSLPDHRLFVRLPPNHVARKMDTYAIFSSLWSQLGTNSNALKEVQMIKTGFALCPTSKEALLTLEAQKEVISTYFGDCQIEQSSHWISYRYSMILVDLTILSAEITEQTGYRPISVSETTASATNANSLSSS